MPKKDIDIIADELWWICKEYNGIPSQTVDKKAYSKALYILKTYGETPQIKAVIKEYNLSLKNYNKDKESRIAEVLAILEERKAMPHSSQEKALYGFVKDFFKQYKDDPDIEKIKYQYAGPSCYPLPDYSTGEKQTQWDYSGMWKKKKIHLAFDYVKYVWKRYGIVPADNTKPMQEVMDVIHCFCRYIGKRSSKEEIEILFSFSKQMEELGCKDENLCGFHNCPKLDTEEIQEKIRALLIENGACAVKYISQKVLPNTILSAKYIYYYYYNHAYYSEDFSPKMPLGRIYVKERDSDCGTGILYVNYRDYHLCNVKAIRDNAQANYRNWIELPPITLEDWKVFGQCCFFLPDTDKNRWDEAMKKMPLLNWNETTVQHAFNTSIPYFYFINPHRYVDFYCYLLEHGYEISYKDSRYFVGYKELAEKPEIAALLKEKNIEIE